MYKAPFKRTFSKVHLNSRAVFVVMLSCLDGEIKLYKNAIQYDTIRQVRE